MRLRTKLVLLTALSALPFVLVLPFALNEVQRAFEQELDGRLAGAEQAARAALDDLSAQVERAVRDLALDPDIEGLARAQHRGELDTAEMVPLGERLMALAGLEVLEILDAEGRILTSGHLPARAGDPDPDALRLASEQPGGAAPRLVELRSEDGIAPGLGVLAARPVDWGSSRVYVVGGRLLGEGWARRVSDLTGAAVTVRREQKELARTAQLALPRGRTLPVGDAAAPLGLVQVEVSGAALAKMERRLVLGAAALWVALLLASALLGTLVARRISRPVDALAAGARALAHGELGSQVEVRSSGELAELVEAFNAMSTGLKSATERAALAERVAAWQGVARRLAHEIKNPLTPIRMSMETLVAAHRGRRPQFDALFEESATAVLEEVERLRRIVDEFSRFARLPKPQLAALDLAELADAVLALYQAPGEGVRVERDLAPGVAVLADRDQLTQVLLNLLTNAQQAMGPAGGAIRVRVKAVGEAEAVLEVEDQGPGIKPEDRASIFEPYFTTKTGGTGLGLAIALRIAQEHGGRLEEVGEPGKGACFRLALPRAAVPPRALAQ